MRWGLMSQAVPPEPGSWTDLLLGPLGLLVGLILAVWALGTRRVVPRAALEEALAREEHWRSVAFHALGIGEEAIKAVEQTRNR